jgi:hypothetical protein
MTPGSINQVAFLLDAGTAQDLARPERRQNVEGRHNNHLYLARMLNLGQQRQ